MGVELQQEFSDHATLVWIHYAERTKSDLWKPTLVEDNHRAH